MIFFEYKFDVTNIQIDFIDVKGSFTNNNFGLGFYLRLSTH